MEASVFYALFSILFALFAIDNVIKNALYLFVTEEWIEKVDIKLGIFSAYVSVNYLGQAGDAYVRHDRRKIVSGIIKLDASFEYGIAIRRG
jgi:hypothetical protein